MLVRTLKRCSGKFNFPPDVEINLPDAAVKDLLADGAVLAPKSEPSEPKQAERPTKGK